MKNFLTRTSSEEYLNFPVTSTTTTNDSVPNKGRPHLSSVLQLSVIGNQCRQHVVDSHVEIRPGERLWSVVQPLDAVSVINLGIKIKYRDPLPKLLT